MLTNLYGEEIEITRDRLQVGRHYWTRRGAALAVLHNPPFGTEPEVYFSREGLENAITTVKAQRASFKTEEAFQSLIALYEGGLSALRCS